MPGQPAPGNGNRTLRFQDELWAEFDEVCRVELGVSRNERLIERAQADVDAHRHDVSKCTDPHCRRRLAHRESK